MSGSYKLRTNQPTVDYRKGETPTGKKESVPNSLGQSSHLTSQGTPVLPIRGHIKKHPAAQ